MKLKKNLVLRQVAQNWVVVPLVDKTLDFSGIITLNDSGAMLWKRLETGCGFGELVSALTAEYNVSEEVAKADVEVFLNKLKQADCMED